jgi:hypothetical protein
LLAGNQLARQVLARSTELTGSPGFDTAEAIAPVATEAVGIITLFRCGIENTIAATWQRAIEATESILRIGVALAEVALLTGILAGIAAEARAEAAIGSADVGQRAVECRRLALLAEGLLDNAIAAVAALQVAIRGVAVITFLSEIPDAVTADEEHIRA